VHVREIVLPEGISLVTDSERTVIAIHPPRVAKDGGEAAADETPAS
jgi:hypothetical protein